MKSNFIEFWNEKIANSWQFHFILICSLSCIMLLYCLPDRRHESDAWCWINWSIAIQSHGFFHAYKSGTNYPPLYQYVLGLYAWIQKSPEDIVKNIQLLKLITFIFHCGSTFFLILILRLYSPTKELYKKYIFYFLNVSVLYNSILWGQVDEILTFFIVGAVYFSFIKRTILSLVFLLLSVNMKLQGIIFVPILAILLLPDLLKFSPKQYIRTIIILLIIESIIVFPFFLGGELDKVWNVYTHSVDNYPIVSMNAYNLWTLIFNKASFYLPDTDKFLLFSYKNWGLFIFFLSSFITLIPILRISYLQFKNINITPSLKIKVASLVCGIIPLLFFFCNTQMHERYSHPLIIFMILYSIMQRNILIGLLSSIAYLQNLDGVLRTLSFQNYNVLIYEPRFVAAIFALVLILAFIELHKAYQKI